MGARSTRGCSTLKQGCVRLAVPFLGPTNQTIRRRRGISGARQGFFSRATSGFDDNWSHSTSVGRRMIARTLGSLTLGYALGTMPSADLVSRFAGGPDPRTVGSRNPGAANTATVLGPGPGLAVLAADIAKGAAAGRVGRHLAGAVGADVAATAAVVGHCYPVWNRFRGGKGVATSVGQVLATFPAYFPIDLAVAVGTAAIPGWKQRAFAATTVSSAVWVVGSTLWWRRQLPNAWGPAPTGSLPLAAAASSLVIVRRFLDAQGVHE